MPSYLSRISIRPLTQRLQDQVTLDVTLLLLEKAFDANVDNTVNFVLNSETLRDDCEIEILLNWNLTVAESNIAH